MQKENLVTFACSVCGREAEPLKPPPEGFTIAAYDGVMEWSDFEDAPPPEEERHWQRSEVPPRQGQHRCVRVRFPFRCALGEALWVLFMPALAWFNGWDAERPEEIDHSAIVQCRFEELQRREEHAAWIRIEVLEVIPLGELCERFPVVRCSDYLDAIKTAYDRYSETDYGEWIEYSWNAQSDLGAWGLVRKHTPGSLRMVLYCQWGFHEDTVYCGNLEVNEGNAPVRKAAPRRRASWLAGLFGRPGGKK